jgi:AAHS family 4-hydroxybenzoate transporter-like MFS transporter
MVSLLLGHGFGWRVIFILGGAFPLVLVPILALWLPEVLHLVGLTPAQGVFPTTPYPLGGLCAALYLGLLIDRFGPERALALHYALGAAFIALIALVAMPYALLFAMIFFAGLTIFGSQTGLNGTCGKLYPARMRTSGLGWAIGVGRVGSVVAPMLGGYLLSIGLPPTQIFLSACLVALVAATATALLVLRGAPAGANRPELVP